MPGRHTAKQKRQAKHIAESERTRGVDPKRAESIGWATVNKQKGVEKATSSHPTFTQAGEGVHSAVVPHGTYSISKPHQGTGGKHRLEYWPKGSTRHTEPAHTRDYTSHAAAVLGATSHHEIKKGPFDDHVSVRPPSISGGERRDSYTETVKVPDVLKPPRTQSQAPRTEGGFNPRSKAPETRQVADTRPADPRTVPNANTKFSPAGDIRPKQSTPAPAPKPPMVAQKSVEKGPGFKPTPIASRTKESKKPIDIEIGPATVTTVPKKPVSLDIGPATVTTMPKQKPVTLDIGPATVTPVPKQKPTMVARKAVTPQEAEFREMTEKLKRRAGQTRKRPFGRRGITAFGKAEKATMGKSFQVMSIGDYYDSMMKAEGGPPAPAAPGAALPKPKKFPRKEKPTVKMKPISDQEAITNLRAGKFHEKSLVMLAAIKALVSGYNKVSGGGALRAPNRGFMSVGDLQRAMEAMPKPQGAMPPATTYLPGVHGPEVKQRAAKMRAKTSKRVAAKADYASSMEEPTLKKQKNVVHKAEGDASMSKTNFNDLFKSELGVANDDVLVDCPHCEAPITKSDLAKAHKGKGAATNVSGPKTAGGNLRSQNPEGGTMRGGDGKGQVTPSRGVPGAQKTDVVAGVQNSKGSKTHKAMDDESSCADDVSSAGAASSKAKKSMSVRGTDFVQYIDYGDAPGSDASIAKSIAEAQGALGQQATQPMDLNNDLSRLLV